MGKRNPSVSELVMQDEGDMYAVEQPVTGRTWLRALKVIGAILVVYVLLVSALVLVGA